MSTVSILMRYLNSKFFNNNLSLSILILNFDHTCSEKNTKWYTFKNSVVKNTMLSDELKERATYLFCGVQRLVSAVNILKAKWKRTKCKKYDCDYDLNLTPLNKFSQQDIIALVEHNTIYRFTLFDLIKIVNNGLMACEYMDAMPTNPKNPYTNKEFSLHNIYNIFLSLRFHKKFYNLKAHIISYYQCNFDLQMFYECNRIMLKKNAVRQYIDTEETSTLFEYACEMFEDYQNIVDITLDTGLRNKQKYVDETKHLLFYYLFLQQISTNNDIHAIYYKKLVLALKAFKADHPTYGRLFATRRYISRSSLFSNIREQPNASPASIFGGNILQDARSSIFDLSDNTPFFMTNNPFNQNNTVASLANIVTTSSTTVTTSDNIQIRIDSETESILNSVPSSNIPSLEQWVENNVSERKEEEDDSTDSVATSIFNNIMEETIIDVSNNIGPNLSRVSSVDSCESGYATNYSYSTASVTEERGSSDDETVVDNSTPEDGVTEQTDISSNIISTIVTNNVYDETEELEHSASTHSSPSTV